MYLIRQENTLNVDYSQYYKILKSRIRRSSLSLYFSLPLTYTQIKSPYLHSDNINFFGSKNNLVSKKFKKFKLLNYTVYNKYGLKNKFYYSLFNILSSCENKFYVPWYLHSNKKKINYTHFSQINRKNKTKIGILNIYELLNTFHFVITEKLTNKVLFSYSSGIASSNNRNNRKNRYIVELCGQQIIPHLQRLNIKYLKVKLHNRIRKNLIKLFFKAFKKSKKLKIIRFYDFRKKPFNGCLKRKARRL